LIEGTVLLSLREQLMIRTHRAHHAGFIHALAHIDFCPVLQELKKGFVWRKISLRASSDARAFASDYYLCAKIHWPKVLFLRPERVFFLQ